ncbi:hypothetical protein GCM10027056_11500 [Glaciibacter psychrotolerans]
MFGLRPVAATSLLLALTLGTLTGCEVADFLAWGMTTYPAEHYAVIIADHGASWPGVGGDESAEEDTLSLAELEPGHSWDYTSLQYLVDTPDADVDDLGRALIEGFEAQAQDEQTDAEITLSLVDLTRMAEVDDALATFSTTLSSRIQSIAPAVGRSRAQTINDVVVAKVDGPVTRGATGLSIYFPPSADAFDSDYEQLSVATSWLDFLHSYYTRGQETSAASGSFTSGATASFDSDGVTVTAHFDAAAATSITETFIRYGLVEGDGSITYLGQETAELPDDSGLIEGSYDLSFLTISDGETEMNGYLDLVVDSDTGDLISELYYSYNARTGNYGALTAEPAGIIAPELLTVLADGSEEWAASADDGLWADLPALGYDFPRLPSGTVLLVDLVAIDLGGNRSVASVQVVVPWAEVTLAEVTCADGGPARRGVGSAG